MRSPCSQRLARYSAILALSAFAGLAGAQNSEGQAAPAAGGAAQPAEAPTPAGLLKDFIYYTRINRYDVASGYARQLFDMNLSPQQFVKVVEESGELSRFEQTLPRALRVPELEEAATRMLTTFERGKLERARDPEQIKANIEGLTGTFRGNILSRERLLAASEYAMPQLLGALLDRSNRARQEQVRSVMIDMGRAAIIPLATALPRLAPEQQESVVDVLGLIPYKTSVPFIQDLHRSTKIDAVRQACERATARLEGAAGVPGDVADLYRALAEGYYDQRSDLTSFPGEEFQLLWSYDPGLGLIMTAIRTEVFHEAMAMRFAERSLELRDNNPGALSLWVASNFRREIQTPQGYQNPAYGADRREAMYYAVAAGSVIEQSVLGIALDDRDTPLVRKAIGALEKSAGGSSLWAGGSRRTLPEALTYPNRRVQYEAALALAAAGPREKFNGSERVVPILAGAIRESTSKIAAVVAPDNETYQSVRAMLERDHYTVLSFGRSLTEIAAPIAESPAVDLLVVVNPREESVNGQLEEIRGTPKVAATPVLVLTSSDAYSALRRRHDRDVTVSIRQSALAEAQILRAVSDLVQSASGGPIGAEESKVYAARALSALRDFALSGNPVFDVGDAALPLISALGETKGQTRLDVAEVLSRVGQERTQVALMDSALTATGTERVALLGKVADSAKRYGNMLASRQVEQLIVLAGSKDEVEATAAAALMGALNLPNSQLIPLIIGRHD